MAEIADLIRDIEREIESDKKALAEKEAGLRLLKSRVASAGALVVAQTSKTLQPAVTEELFDLTSLEIEGLPRKRTFIDDLKDAVRRFGPQEFSIAHVEVALRRLGIEVAGKTPRSRISASMSKLWDEGVLVRTFEGSGNVPNRFKLREFLKAEELLKYEDGVLRKAGSASGSTFADNEDAAEETQ